MLAQVPVTTCSPSWLVEADSKTPASYNYTLGVQQDIGFKTVVAVSYVGSFARHLGERRNVNEPPDGAIHRQLAAAGLRDGWEVHPPGEGGGPEVGGRVGQLRLDARPVSVVECVRSAIDTLTPALDAKSIRIDSQTISPEEAFSLEHECGAGGCQQAAGNAQ